MDIQEEIKAAFERLTTAERASVLRWLSEFEAHQPLRVEEPAFQYKTAPEPALLTVDEYLKREAESPLRHEYVAGQMFAMTGTTVRHNVILRNLISALSEGLHGGPCQTFFNDIKVRLRVESDDIFYYPDVLVACGELDMSADHVTDPRLIIEVLSPSTEAIDRREKAMNYRHIASLEEYMLVAQRAPEVTLYRRSRQWAPQRLTALEACVELRSVGLSLLLTQIYEKAL